MVNQATNKQRFVRVLMMTQSTLLGDVLENILSQALTLLVHRVLFADADIFWQTTDYYQPQVIILEEGIICERSLCLSGERPGNGRPYIILVSPQVNQVSIHNQFQISLRQAADFIALVENHPSQWPNGLAAGSDKANIS
jgi:hypothetical protein